MDEVEIISEREIQREDENSNSRNASRNGGRSAVDRDEQKDKDIVGGLKDKARKISNDEDDTEDGESLSDYSESDGTELTANEEDLPFKESKTLETDHTANRLDAIERKLERIEARLNEKDNDQDSERRNIDRIRVSDEQYVQLMVKKERLETENKALKDENYALRTKILDLQKMLENPGNIPCIETSSQASIMKLQQGPQSQSFLGIPREKQRFTTNNPKKDIQPGMRNDAENLNFKENQNKRDQPWGVSTEKNYNQQGIWQFNNDAEISNFKESQMKKSQPWGVPMEKTCSLSEQKEIGAQSQNIWQFPKRSATTRREIPTQVVYRNRLQILADAGFEEENCMPTGHMLENESLLRDETLRTFVGAKTTTTKKRKPNDEIFFRSKVTTPKKPKPSDNRPGLANQEKQDQNGMQTETTKAQSFGRRKPTVAFIGCFR